MINRFKVFALALPEVEEKSHFGKPDFRVKNKIFAGFSAEGRAYVKLRPEQQFMLTSAEPNLISADKGHWGKMGWTWVEQINADDELLKSVLDMAWKNVAPKFLQK